mmetsp:Transcript_46040/g.53231  ORF Transcript_46040/g.53231 Transcript_46040/m.53231 type:complete len:224 (-) Transcript_46040:238-909(-)
MPLLPWKDSLLFPFQHLLDLPNTWIPVKENHYIQDVSIKLLCSTQDPSVSSIRSQAKMDPRPQPIHDWMSLIVLPTRCMIIGTNVPMRCVPIVKWNIDRIRPGNPLSHHPRINVTPIISPEILSRGPYEKNEVHRCKSRWVPLKIPLRCPSISMRMRSIMMSWPICILSKTIRVSHWENPPKILSTMSPKRKKTNNLPVPILMLLWRMSRVRILLPSLLLPFL